MQGRFCTLRFCDFRFCISIFRVGFLQVFFAVSSWRAEHIALEDFRIIAGTGETDLNGDICNGEIVILQKRETLFDAAAKKKVKGSVILLHIQHIKAADQIAAGGMLRVPAVDQNIVKIRIIQDRGDKICLKKTVLEAVDQDWIEDKANVPAVAALVLFSRVQGVRVDQNAVCFFLGLDKVKLSEDF